LKWETITDNTIGVDFSILKGLFGVTIDLYKRTTHGGHATSQIPASVGKTAPSDNYKDMENKGFDLLLTHANKIGEVRYDVSVILSMYRNKITKIKDNVWSDMSQVVGHPYQEYWMLDWVGVYQNQNQVDNLPIYEPYRGQTKPGDLIYYDRNGDGQITVENETGDKIFAPGRHPDFTYSLNVNLAWKNFDLSMFWQGVQGRKIYLFSGNEPFGQGSPPGVHWRNAWDGEGTTNSMPALYNMITYNYAPITGQANTFRLDDASYLRLKNLQIGYNVPVNAFKPAGISAVRVYVSGDNLLNFSSYKWGDPERNDVGTIRVFPQLKTFTFGLNVTF
jgi:hypothetical protein